MPSTDYRVAALVADDYARWNLDNTIGTNVIVSWAPLETS
jgi:hypothetical protein